MSEFKDMAGVKRFAQQAGAIASVKINQYSLYLAGYHIKLMRDRIARGEDLSGMRFKPYHPLYAKWKKANHSPYPDWLRLSDGPDSMLNTLSAEKLPRPGDTQIIFGTPRARELSAKNTQWRTHMGYQLQETEILQSKLDDVFFKDVLAVWHAN